MSHATPGSGTEASSGRPVFDVGGLSGSVRGKAVSAGLLTSAAQVIKFVLNLGGMMVLGRLLEPKDFGILGMVLGFTSFLSIFTNLGLSVATVQVENLSETDASNVFWMGLGLSTLVGLVTAALGPVISWFYHDPRLTLVTVLLGVTFPLAGLANQHRALLTRRMQFGKIAIIEIAALFGSMAVACAMAAEGFGYWSLIGMQISSGVVTLALTWWMAAWSPLWPSRGGESNRLLKLGAELSASGVVYYIARGCDTVFLGKFWGATITGYYTRAFALLVRPVDQVLSPIGSVLLPTLARLRAEPERFRRAFLQVYNCLGLIFFPMAGLFLALSKPMVIAILGSQWTDSTSLFAGLTLAFIYLPYTQVGIWVFTSEVRSRDLLVSTTAVNILMVAAYAFGVRYSAFAMVICYAISGVTLRLPVVFYLVGRKGPIRTSDMWFGFAQHFPLYGAAYLGGYVALRMVPNGSALAQLCVGLPLGGLASLVTMLILPPQRKSLQVLAVSFKSMLEAKRNRAPQAAVAAA